MKKLLKPAQDSARVFNRLAETRHQNYWLALAKAPYFFEALAKKKLRQA